MEKLSKEWFLEGLLDFEYKKYVLLAYLQHVSREFAEMRLYPSFADLIDHYNSLTFFRDQQRKLFDQFPKTISLEDFRKLKPVYTTLEEDPHLAEIESIVDYAIPEIKDSLKSGKEIYDYIEDQLTIEPIGLTPLYKNEGYILLRQESTTFVKAFEYKIVFFENVDANFHGIYLNYLDSYQVGIANTYESVKRTLVNTHKRLPNPATWLLYTLFPFPEEASLLPIAKRKMLSYLK